MILISKSSIGKQSGLVGVANFHCMQMSLVMSMRFMSAMIEMSRHVHHASALFLSNRGSCIDFRVFIHACSINSETNRRL